MSSLTKELVQYLPSLQTVPEHLRPVLESKYAELVQRTESRLSNFMPNTPEAGQIRAEMVAVAQTLLANSLLPAAQNTVQGPVEIGPGWQEAGRAFGQLSGLAIRATLEIATGIIVGFGRGLFAAKPTSPSQVQLPEIISQPIQSPKIHVHVEVDVRT